MQSAVLVDSEATSLGSDPWSRLPLSRPTAGSSGMSPSAPQRCPRHPPPPHWLPSPHALEEFDVPIVQTVIHEFNCIVSWKEGRRQVWLGWLRDGPRCRPPSRADRTQIKDSRFTPMHKHPV